MADSITASDLNKMASRINAITGNPDEYDKGHFYFEKCSSPQTAKLVQVITDAGAERSITIKASYREAYHQAYAYLMALENVKSGKVTIV